MNATQPTPGTVIAPLLYWLLVVGGLLAAHRVLEHGAATVAGALWVGSVLGTAIGQAAAWRRLPIWVLAVAVPVLMAAAIQLSLALCATTGLTLSSREPWDDVGLGVMAFLPAVACGYASMSERGGVAAFWFPTSLWALAILDRVGATSLTGTWRWMLLTVLAALFIAFLAAREVRRITLWRGHATVRLSTSHATAVLRRSPTRSLTQAVWAAATAGATLVLTAWVAPHLWQNESTGAHGSAEMTHAAGGLGGGMPCCPDVPDTATTRLREYFPLLHRNDDGHPAEGAHPCVACGSGASAVGASVQLSPLPEGETCDGPAIAQAVGGAPGAPSDASSSVRSNAGQLPPWVPPPPTPRSPPPPPGQVPSPAPAGVLSAGAPASNPAPSALAAAPQEPDPSASFESHPLSGLLALAFCALLVQLALRPLRRLVTLRHLRQSLWPEPVDQRVSNVWQLVLVGLRDAGWYAAPGEQPLALARRAAVPGAEACAIVLERVRHGARLEPLDLRVMGDAARTAYRAARGRTGRLARVLSWLRWPLA